MLVKFIMKIFQKFFKNDQKLNASEIAFKTDINKYKTLDNVINDLLPTVLFEGIGDTSITLNDNLANYKRIKIYYYQTAYHDTSYSSVEVYEPDGKNVELSFVMGVSDNSGLYANNRCYLLNGTNVTKTDGYNARFYNSASNWAIADAIRISKIIGYKN